MNNGPSLSRYSGCAWQRRQKKVGVMDLILEVLATDLKESGKLDLTECFIDGTFAPAKNRGPGVGKTKRGKGAKVMAVAGGNGLPVAIYVTSASPHELKLVGQMLNGSFVKRTPTYFIGDKACDSDPFDKQLAEAGIELIAPHRSNRVKPAIQDGRKLRRYKRRWKVERLLA